MRTCSRNVGGSLPFPSWDREQPLAQLSGLCASSESCPWQRRQRLPIRPGPGREPLVTGTGGLRQWLAPGDVTPSPAVERHHRRKVSWRGWRDRATRFPAEEGAERDMATATSGRRDRISDPDVHRRPVVRRADGGKTLAVINPADEAVVAEVAYGGRAEAERAIEAAARAFPAWRAALGLRPGQGPQEDRRPDARAGRRHRPHADAWSRASRWPRPRPRCCTPPTPSSGSPRRASGPTARSSRQLERRPSGTYAIKHPVGVVGTITPVELPGHAAQPQDRPGPGRRLHHRLPAGRARRRCALIQMFECLVDAGLPPGVANLVIGPAQEIADEFFENPAVRKISFTGSTEVGKELIRAVGRPGEAAQPGAGRPRPVHRLPRRRRRSRWPRPPSSASSATTARSASPRAGSTSTRTIAEEVHRGGRRAGQGAQARQRPGAGRRGRPDVRGAGRWTRPRPDRGRPGKGAQDPDRRRAAPTASTRATSSSRRCSARSTATMKIMTEEPFAPVMPLLDFYEARRRDRRRQQHAATAWPPTSSPTT